MQFIFFGIVLLVYGLLNFYIGLRGYQGISAQIPISKILYWAVIILISSTYIIGMLGRNFIPQRLVYAFNLIGGYWMAAFVYLLVFAVLTDIFRFLGKKLNLIPNIVANNTWFIVFFIVAIVAVLLMVGTYNAITPKVSDYEITVEKKAGKLKQLKCAMISDVHLGEIVKRDRMKKAVEIINGLNPDIVIIAGDLIDNSVEPVKRENMLEELKNVKSRYGTYAAFGNHEYFSGSTEEITTMIEAAGVTVLRDKMVKIDDSFYLVGREDMTGTSFGFTRSKLESLTVGRDEKLPLLVIDHQPSGLEEAKKTGVDLQFSGHTHAGQFFPINIITSLIYKNSFGYLKEGDFNLLVSCGYGTWGPTVRLGSQSEVLDVTVNFSGK